MDLELAIAIKSRRFSRPNAIYPAISGINAPLWYTTEQNIFQEYGLEGVPRWKHLRTSNVVESPFSRVRLRTEASRRFKSQVNATCLIWKTMMVAEMSFRKLDAPELVAKVVDGTRYEDGEEIQEDRDAA